MKGLLIESMPLTFELVEAADGKPNRLRVRGEFARHDKPTANGRLYKEDLWRREIGKLTEGMKDRRNFGELDHPADGRTKLARVSHLITDLRVEGHKVVGEAEILDTPNGRIMEALLKAGARVGISSRGTGSVKQLSDGTNEVQEDFELHTFDFVADPADRTAYPTMVSEAVEVERHKVEAAGDDLSVESLRRDYPGLVAELTAHIIAESGGGGATMVESAAERAHSLVEAEQRAESKLVERFQRDLPRQLERVRAEAYQRAITEASADPAVAAARAICEQIAVLVQPFGGSTSGVPASEEVTKRLAAQDDEIASLRDREAKMVETVRRLTLQLRLEQRVRDVSDREAIVTIVGDVASYANVESLDARLDAVLAEMAKTRKGFDERVAEAVERIRRDMDPQIDALSRQVATMSAELAESNRVAAEAERRVRLAESRARQTEVRGHIDGRVSGRSDAAKIRALAESASSVVEADSIIDGYLATASTFTPGALGGMSEADRVRARIGRGRPSPLREDADVKSGGTGLAGELGFESDVEMKRLAGIPSQ